MEIIELEDRKIYRPAKGKKVKFANRKEKYTEIVLKKEDTRRIMEVE